MRLLLKFWGTFSFPLSMLLDEIKKVNGIPSATNKPMLEQLLGRRPLSRIFDETKPDKILECTGKGAVQHRGLCFWNEEQNSHRMKFG